MDKCRYAVIKNLEAMAAELRYIQCSVSSIGETSGLQKAIDAVNNRIEELIAAKEVSDAK